MKLFRIVTTGVILTALAVPVSAQIVGGANNWQGGNGDWSVASNWTQNSAADNRDQAIITTAGNTVSVTQAWPQAPAGTPDATLVGALRMENAVTLNIASGLTLTTDGRFGSTTLPGAPNNSNWNFAIGQGATVTGDGNTVHTLGQGVAGQTFIGEATFSGTGTTEFQSNVTISAPNNTSLTFGRSVTTDATTTWTSNNANQQGDVIVTGSWTNNGTLNRTQTNNNGGLQLNGTGSFTNSATGILNVTGGNDFVVNGGGTFNNAGALNIDGGELNVTAVTFNAQSGSTLNLSNNGLFVGSTTFDGATLSGSGAVNGTTIVQNGGNISPGNSPGTLTVNGDLTVDASTVTMELGPVAGTSDLLDVMGNLTLQNGASIALQFFGGYDTMTAAPGDSFQLLAYSTATGLTAASFDFSAVGGAGFWDANIGANSASITFVPEPSSLAFLGLGVMGFAFRRRRS